jgi:hypothetical protein
MKRIFVAAILASAAVAPAVAQGPAMPVIGGAWQDGPTMYFGAGGVYMTRTRGSDRLIVQNDLGGVIRGPFGAPIVTQGTLNTFSFEPGFEVMAGFRLNDNWWVFGEFLWIAGSQSTQTASSALGQLGLPFTADVSDNFDGANGVIVGQRSRFYAGRLGARYLVNSWLYLSVGARIGHLDERIDITMNDGEDGVYNLRASNLLVGPEFGVGVKYPVFRGLALHFEGGVGALANFRTVNHFIRDVPGAATQRNESNASTGFSFLGYAKAGATYQVTNSILIYAGYQMIYLSGLALSQRELNFDTTGGAVAQGVGVRGGGSAIYHGGMAGLKIVW